MITHRKMIRFHATAVAVPLCIASPVLAAAEAGSFGTVITGLTLAVAAAAAWLPLAAWRHWRGPWRSVALAPLFLLLLWVALIVAGRAAGASAHPLWPLEIFAWAMATMVYMVAALTVKSILNKSQR